VFGTIKVKKSILDFSSLALSMQAFDTAKEVRRQYLMLSYKGYSVPSCRKKWLNTLF